MLRFCLYFQRLLFVTQQYKIVSCICFKQGEEQSLLGSHAFDRFLEEQDPAYLGVAMEDANWLSKSIFYWVNPLMNKGAQGKLNSPDDLFDLPVYLSCSSVNLKLDKALIGNIDDVQKRILQQRYQGINTSCVNLDNTRIRKLDRHFLHNIYFRQPCLNYECCVLIYLCFGTFL